MITGDPEQKKNLSSENNDCTEERKNLSAFASIVAKLQVENIYARPDASDQTTISSQQGPSDTPRNQENVSSSQQGLDNTATSVGTHKKSGHEESSIEKEAWELLRNSMVFYCGSPVGTIAANDPTDPNPLNYDQVFIRDFIPSSIAFLLKAESDIVKNLFSIHFSYRSLVDNSFKSIWKVHW